MDNTKAFELKVGVFILIGIAILFLIVFSIGDINLSKTGYKIKARFNFAAGIGGAAPVRLAGVGIGQLQGVRIIYDNRQKKTQAELTAWINDKIRIEEDATATINTLGLLGEKYLEIIPGTPGKNYLKNGDTITGKDPVAMDRVTENVARLSESASIIVERLKNGEGTVGKLLTEDAVYNELKSTMTNFKEFSEDLKKHPWKLLSRPRED